MVENPPPPPPNPEIVELESRLALHSIYFPTAMPPIKNPNGGLLASQRQTLVALASDFKKYLQSKPDAHLILEGTPISAAPTNTIRRFPSAASTAPRASWSSRESPKPTS